MFATTTEPFFFASPVMLYGLYAAAELLWTVYNYAVVAPRVRCAFVRVTYLFLVDLYAFAFCVKGVLICLYIVGHESALMLWAL